MTSAASPHSPPSPTTLANAPSSASYQHLSDADHCFPPSSSSPTIALGRARSGSRTYSEVQEDERRERERVREGSTERERRWAEAEQALEGRTSGEALRVPQEPQEAAMSAIELRAEMETLLSLRRRSMSQPASVDPDLPPTAPPTSPAPPPPKTRPQLSLTITPPAESITGGPISPTAPSPAETGTLVRRVSTSGGRLPSQHPLPVPPLPSPTHPATSPLSPYAPSDAAQSAQDLFWLPASLHPELAPQEFKAFIREQTQPEALARRSSLSATGGRGGARVGRRASMLRGEYKPSQDDGVGDAPEGAVKRTASVGGTRRGSRNTLNFEELTIKDLQRLEELAAKAEAEGKGDDEGEGERLGRVLRRSLSLNPHRVAAAAAAAGATFSYPIAEEDSTGTDEAPIIVPPPGQILRRNARTKIRKGSIGEYAANRAAGGSRFGGPRRTRSSTSETGVQLAPAGQMLWSAVDDDSLSTGDVSFESGESEDVRPVSGEALAVSPVGVEDVYGQQQHIPTHSPTSSENQHIEVVDKQEAVLPPVVPYVVLEEPKVVEEQPMEPSVVPGFPVVAPPVSGEPPQPPPREPSPPLPPASQPEAPSRHAISPASPEYDWSTHNLQLQQQQQQQPPLPPTPPPEPQYTVHPSHSLRQPFADVPPPQAVPVPLPERKSTPSPAPRAESPKPAGKEKKSGWARLGLGKEEKKKKDKGKEKEKDSGADKSDSASERGEKEKESSGGFFGGLFGRKRAESDHSPPPAPTPPVATEARMPPPPPTASGALLPNGKYVNYYRLPIHVERAVYRLSHIKLANPRRPLYEQVLISNLMFWYLGLIQKPVQPPPAAQPVPIPGMRNQQGGLSSGPSNSAPTHDQQQQQPGSFEQQQRNSSPPHKEKRAGLSKPGRGTRTAETPMRPASYEVQNQRLAEEQQQQQYLQHQQRQLSQSHPQPGSSSSSHNNFFPLPLSSTSTSDDGHKRPSPDRSSAPAQMYGSRTPNNSVEGGDGAEDEDDDRPLGSFPSSSSSGQQQQFRESYPQHHRPVPVSAYPKSDQGFQVTSRSSLRLFGGADGQHLHPSPNSSSLDAHIASSAPHAHHERRASAVSDKSFDAAEIYDAYAPSPGSPNLSNPVELPSSAPPPHPSVDISSPSPSLPHQPEPQPEKKKAPLLGTVAPRGSSLKALVSEKGKRGLLSSSR
ncbi:hypothetical protein JCM8547_006682 [Rhodosporidiobolus lusitaniae]